MLLALVFSSVSASQPQSKADYFMFVVRQDCLKPYFSDLAWLSLDAWKNSKSPFRECLSDTISKGLGVGIILGSVLVNILQVHKVWKAGTGRGLNLGSQYQAMWSNLLASVWWVWEGAPISAYGECIMQALGPAALIALLWRFSSPGAAHAASVLAVTVGILSLAFAKKAALSAAIIPYTPLGTPENLSVLVVLLANASFWASRLGQIYTTYSAGSDKAQSIFTLAANALGSSARVYTGMKEIKAPPALKPFYVYILTFNTLLNWTMVGQWLRYNVWKGKKRAAAAGKKKEVVSTPSAPPKTESAKKQLPSPPPVRPASPSPAPKKKAAGKRAASKKKH